VLYGTVTFSMTLSGIRRSFQCCCYNLCAQLTRDLFPIAKFLVDYRCRNAAISDV